MAPFAWGSWPQILPHTKVIFGLWSCGLWNAPKDIQTNGILCVFSSMCVCMYVWVRIRVYIHIAIAVETSKLCEFPVDFISRLCEVCQKCVRTLSFFQLLVVVVLLLRFFCPLERTVFLVANSEKFALKPSFKPGRSVLAGHVRGNRTLPSRLPRRWNPVVPGEAILAKLLKYIFFAMYFNLIDAWPLFCGNLRTEGRDWAETRRQSIQPAAYAIQLV